MHQEASDSDDLDAVPLYVACGFDAPPAVPRRQSRKGVAAARAAGDGQKAKDCDGDVAMALDDATVPTVLPAPAAEDKPDHHKLNEDGSSDDSRSGGDSSGVAAVIMTLPRLSVAADCSAASAPQQVAPRPSIELPVPDVSLHSICAALPVPEDLCAPGFAFARIDASSLEPAHVLASGREESTHVQAPFEYQSEVFSVPEDPLLWRHMQQRKYSHWAAMHPSCRRVTVKLVPQPSLCRTASRFHQPQCRVCIARTGGKRCRFADVRYITQLTIELVRGATATRYLICPAFRSQIEKAPAIRQQIAPITLPGDRVVYGDESWIEFHILCQTVASIKSLLRRELAVVRDVLVHEARGFGNGCISFFDTAVLPQLVLDGGANAVHPLYGCSPTPCILRRVPFGAHQKCDMCLAPIFSTYFSCCLCMVEYCVDCYSEWDDSDVTERCYVFEKGTRHGEDTKGDAQTDSGIAMSYCKRFTFHESDKAITHSTRHKKCQFVRMSHFSEAELELMLRKANRIVQYCDLLDETQPAGYSSISLCANALRAGDLTSREDHSWTSAILDRIDRDTAVIANLGDADYCGSVSSRPSPADICAALETPGAGPSHSQSQYLEALWDEKIRSLLLSARLPLQDWQRPPVYVPADGLSLREFSRLWEEGYVVVITGLLTEELEATWTPAALEDAIGALCAPVFEMGARRSPVGDWPLRRLLQCLRPGYAAEGGARNRGKGKSKVKGKVKDVDTDEALDTKLLAAGLQTSLSLDGLPSAKAEGSAEADIGRLEELRRAATAMLPFPQYTSADGSLNLVNRLPGQYARPNFGPELRCMHRGSGADGVENMRCEVADMVSLMAYSSMTDHAPAQQAATDASEPPRRRSRARSLTQPHGAPGGHSIEWDIYPSAAAGMLRAFLEEEAPSSASRRDIACGQQVFMSDHWCRALHQQCGEDARCFRVYQSPGDAVFVPSGCLYQRRALANTVCVQAKFLSPEHAATARQLSNEITSLDRDQRRKQALPVMDILWWTWMGCSTDHAADASATVATPRKAAGSRRRSPSSTPAKRRRSRAPDAPAPDLGAPPPAPSTSSTQQARPSRRQGRRRGEGMCPE
ncbi:hypothetical protein LPJ61_001447 [Coemansia biformis]|uniref:JmjC domain-containing protein n=1 Tax=Coemansia biformis TaxID=1286918 RepID=A0A9W7YF61_9FUNG|nr:hypothetical protein LPJ61_001447 [Coemansia biformis]